jgi:hypothetical protein
VELGVYPKIEAVRAVDPTFDYEVLAKVAKPSRAPNKKAMHVIDD